MMAHFGVAETGYVADNLTEKATENADLTWKFVGNDMADKRRSFLGQLLFFGWVGERLLEDKDIFLDKKGFLESAGKILKYVWRS